MLQKKLCNIALSNNTEPILRKQWGLTQEPITCQSQQWKYSSKVWVCVFICMCSKWTTVTPEKKSLKLWQCKTLRKRYNPHKIYSLLLRSSLIFKNKFSLILIIFQILPPPPLLKGVVRGWRESMYKYTAPVIIRYLVLVWFQIAQKHQLH